MDVKFEGKDVYLDSKVLKFDYEIRDVGVLDDKVVVLLSIPVEVENITDNIFAFNFECETLWRVQPIRERFPNLATILPYESMSYVNGKILANDFYGRSFAINPKDGKLIEMKVTK